MTAVIAAHVVAVPAVRWRSIDRDRVTRWFIQQTPACDSVFALVFGCFSRIKKLLGQTETRARERKDRQSIQTETSPETIKQELRPAVC